MIHQLMRMRDNNPNKTFRLTLVTGGVIVGKLRSFTTSEEEPPCVEVSRSDNRTVLVNVSHVVLGELA